MSTLGQGHELSSWVETYEYSCIFSRSIGLRCFIIETIYCCLIVEIKIQAIKVNPRVEIKTWEYKSLIKNVWL